MIRNHMVATCSEMYNKSIIELLASLSGEPVYSTRAIDLIFAYLVAVCLLSPISITLMEWSASLPKRLQMSHDVIFSENIKTEVRQTMKNNTAKGPITVLGIDLAKQSFQLHGVNAEGKVVLKKKLSRKQISAFVANLPVCLIGLEACGGSHHWVRIFTEMGHTVRMMAPQFVKPAKCQPTCRIFVK